MAVRAYQKNKGGGPNGVDCSRKGRIVRFVQQRLSMAKSILQPTKTSPPVRKGITAVPPPTAVMTRELPNLHNGANCVSAPVRKLSKLSQLHVASACQEEHLRV